MLPEPDPRLGGGATTLSKDAENLGDGGDKLGVQWENRAPMTRSQTMWLYFYAAAVGIFFTDGFICVGKHNIAKVDHSAACPKDWIRRNDKWEDDGMQAGIHHFYISRFCLSPDLSNQWEACMKDLGRDLAPPLKGQETKMFQLEEKQNDMWDILGRNVAVILIVFPSILVAAVAWFFALKTMPFQVVYGTIFLGCAGLVAVAIVFKTTMRSELLCPTGSLHNTHCLGKTAQEWDAQGTQAMIAPILMVLVIAVMTYFCRAYIAFTCRTIRASSTILMDQPHVFGACFVVKLCWILAFALFVWFRCSADNYADVGLTPVEEYDAATESWVPSGRHICSLTHKKANALGGIELFCFLWIVAWFEMAATLICSVSMGGYFFHRDDALAPQSPGFTALQWAFTSSAGSVAESSMTLTLSYYAKRWTSGWMVCACFVNPFWWIFMVIHKCFEDTINTISRFSLIMHGFHGGGMFTEGTRRPPLKALLKHLGTALVSGTVGRGVLLVATGLLSTVMALATFAWLDKAEGAGLMPLLASGGMRALFFLLFFFFFIGYLHKWCLFFLMTMSLMKDSSKALATTQCGVFFASLFVGCVCMMVLQFFVDIVFYSTDGLIYCYVLAAESGQDLDKGELAKFHELIQEIKADNAETQPFADELQPADKDDAQPNGDRQQMPRQSDSEPNVIV